MIVPELDFRCRRPRTTAVTTRRDGEIHAAQGVDRHVADDVRLAELLDLDDGVRRHRQRCRRWGLCGEKGFDAPGEAPGRAAVPRATSVWVPVTTRAPSSRPPRTSTNWPSEIPSRTRAGCGSPFSFSTKISCGRAAAWPSAPSSPAAAPGPPDRPSPRPPLLRGPAVRSGRPPGRGGRRPRPDPGARAPPPVEALGPNRSAEAGTPGRRPRGAHDRQRGRHPRIRRCPGVSTR